MHLKIVGAEDLVFEGDVYGIKGHAVDGSISCLDNHMDYLTVLKKGEVILLKDISFEEIKRISLQEDSILFLENNRALIFT